MKRRSRILLFLLIAVLPITLFAQNPTTIIGFMRVPQGGDAAYMEVEQAWKAVHQKAVELGVHNGWQLWRKMHGGYDDPYQYMTVQWYDNYEHSFGLDAPEGWMESVYTDLEWEALLEKTYTSRVYASEMVSTMVTRTDAPFLGKVNVIMIGRMKMTPGMQSEYEGMEQRFYKPYFEELIKRDQLTGWSIWRVFPREGECTHYAVQAFENVEQLTGERDAISFEELGLGVTQEEVMELTQKTREMVKTEIWVLVDQVLPEQ